eukprot:1847471-Pleurochrysis_carterae.AAC.2
MSVSPDLGESAQLSSDRPAVEDEKHSPSRYGGVCKLSLGAFGAICGEPGACEARCAHFPLECSRTRARGAV